MVIVAALLVAMGLGVYLRWSLAGLASLWRPFEQLRHAHSHLGYFGLLFPLAWLGWSRAGVRCPGPRAAKLYGLLVLVTCVAFALQGYKAVAIAGSSLISLFWLWSARVLLARLRSLSDPLGAVPGGLLLSLACVPPIAIYLRAQPALAQGFVSTFLSGLLFLVFVPSVFAARKIQLAPWPIYLLMGSSASLFLGVYPNGVTRLGLVGFSAILLSVLGVKSLERSLRVLWAMVALGLFAMATGWLPNTRSVALGAMHFLVLAPMLATLSPLWLRRNPSRRIWLLGHLAWGSMCLALVLQAFFPAHWTWLVAAVGGSATLLWWIAVLFWQLGAKPASKQMPGEG